MLIVNSKTKLKLHDQTDLYWVNALLYDDSVGSLNVDSFSAAFTKSCVISSLIEGSEWVGGGVVLDEAFLGLLIEL